MGEAAEINDGETAVSPTHQSFVFEIIDTGVGISPSQQASIFMPYEQTGTAASRNQGTGLGLTISRQLVQLMGGDLHVRSTLGKGSTFWFELTLPVSEIAEEKSQTDTDRISGYKGPQRTVLIVDDVASNRLALKGLMNALGFGTLEANNGLHVLEVLKTEQPDLIIMDRWMTRNGWP